MTANEKANEIKTRIESVTKELYSIYEDYSDYLGDIVADSICDTAAVLDSFTIEEDLEWEALADDFDEETDVLVQNILKSLEEYQSLSDEISKMIDLFTKKTKPSKEKDDIIFKVIF